MQIGLGLNLTSRRGGASAAYTISNGNGVTGTASIVPAGGSNWTVTNSGSPSGPWTVTTTQLESGLPILLADPTITTAAGPIYSVTAGANDALYLVPTLDPAEYAYQWYWNTTTLVATGRTYDATGQTGILVELVITASNYAGSVISRFTAQSGTAFTETMVQFGASSKLTNSGTFAANSPLTFVCTFQTPASLVSTVLWQGGSSYNQPAVYYSGGGQVFIYLDAFNFLSSSGVLVGSTKYTICASVNTTDRRLYIKSGSGAFTTLDNTSAAFTPESLVKNTIGIWDAGTDQFTGKMGRLLLAPSFLDFSVSGNRDAFVDSSGTVVNPFVGRSLFASYGIDFCGSVSAWNAGTNPGTFGNFTKTGSAFT